MTKSSVINFIFVNSANTFEQWENTLQPNILIFFLQVANKREIGELQCILGRKLKSALLSFLENTDYIAIRDQVLYGPSNYFVLQIQHLL